MNPTITITLTDPQLGVIAEALANAPYKVAAPLLAELQRQVTIARQPAPPPAPPAPPAVEPSTVEPPTGDAPAANDEPAAAAV